MHSAHHCGHSALKYLIYPPAQMDDYSYNLHGGSLNKAISSMQVNYI